MPKLRKLDRVYSLAMKPRKYQPEIEIKLPVSDIFAIRKRLRFLQAYKISPRTYESNTLYDTPGQELRRRGRLIRLRIEQPTQASGRVALKEDQPGVLTFKGPQRSSRREAKSRALRKSRSHFKIKEEAEVAVTNARTAARILNALGLGPGFRYEKFRTTYGLPYVPNVKIELDETPVGTYLELEGRTAAIDRAARMLGYTRNDYLTATYGSLYLAECRRDGHQPGNMLFPPTKKSRK